MLRYGRRCLTLAGFALGRVIAAGSAREGCLGDPLSLVLVYSLRKPLKNPQSGSGLLAKYQSGSGLLDSHQSGSGLLAKCQSGSGFISPARAFVPGRQSRSGLWIANQPGSGFCPFPSVRLGPYQSGSGLLTHLGNKGSTRLIKALPAY